MQEWFVTITPFITTLIGGFFTVLAAKDRVDRGRYIAGISLLILIALSITTYLTWRPENPWEKWKKSLYSDFKEFQGDGLHRLKTALKNNPVPFRSKTESVSFYEDIRAGKNFLEHEEIAGILKEKFGIYRDTFTGCGMSVPWDKIYSKALSREYLAPNVHEKDKDVWTWILDPAFANYHRKVKDLVRKSIPTKESNIVELSNHINTIENRMRDPSSIPPLIRFQKFQLKYYSKKVGRDKANKVFFCNLYDVWDMTIEQAAEASGYRITDASSDNIDTKLFVWLYVPTHTHSARLATWKNVFSILQNY